MTKPMMSNAAALITREAGGDTARIVALTGSPHTTRTPHPGCMSSSSGPPLRVSVPVAAVEVVVAVATPKDIVSAVSKQYVVGTVTG